MRKIKSLLLPIYIIMNVLLVMISSYFVMIKKLKMINFSRFYIALLIINILIIIFKSIYNKKNKIKNKIDKIDIIILLIVIFSLISCSI